MTAARGVAASICRVWAEVAGPMHVIGVSFDIVVNMRVDGLTVAARRIALDFLAAHGKMFAALAFEPRALDHVEQVRDDAHLGPKLAVFIEIDAPRIATAFGEHFEHVALGMITPHPGVNARRRRRSGSPARNTG